MLNKPETTAATNIHVTWQAIFWRLLLTLLLLLALAGPGLSIFRGLTENPGSRVIPTITHNINLDR